MPDIPRIRLLLFILAVVGSAYAYLNYSEWLSQPGQTLTATPDLSAGLPLEEDVKVKIRRYIDGVSVDAKDNNLNHAMQLDHSVGRVQISQGKYREALATYKKVLAISYRQGNLMGVGIGLMIIADVAERSDDMDEALYATFLAYKTAQAMKNPEEIGVTELALARRLKKEDPALAMLWLTRAKESLKSSRYKEDYVRVLPGLAEGLRKLHEDQSASSLYQEAWEKAQSLGDAPGQKWAKWEIGIDWADDLVRRKQYDNARKVLSVTESFYSPEEKKSDNYTTVLYRMARVYSMLKNHLEATVAYLSAYAHLDLARLNAADEGARVKLDREFKTLIDSFVDHHLQSNDPRAALAVLESNKARSLSDVFEDPLFEKARGPWKAMQLMHSQELHRVLDRGGLYKKSMLEERLSGALAVLARAHDDAKKMRSEMDLKGTIAAPNMTEEHVDRLRRNMPAHTAMLSFFLGHERSSILVVTAHGVRSVPLAKPAKEYKRAIEQLRLSLTNPYNDFYFGRSL